jgi:hypothetical protein
MSMNKFAPGRPDIRDRDLRWQVDISVLLEILNFPFVLLSLFKI